MQYECSVNECSVFEPSALLSLNETNHLTRLKALAAPVVPHFSTLSMLCCLVLNFHFITKLKKLYSEKKQKIHCLISKQNGLEITVLTSVAKCLSAAQ